MKVIGIACYRRPELTKIYLEQLLKNTYHVNNYVVWFFLDVGYDPKYEELIHWWNRTLGFNQGEHPPRTYRKEKLSKYCPASYNILQSYKDVYDLLGDKLEYFIPAEEDIVPSRDFLRFCEYSYEHYLKPYERIFCVAHKRRQDPQTGDPSVLIGDTQCTSPMVISGRAIKEHMLPHLEREAFYTNTLVYNQVTFPNSRIPWNEHYSHDGQIERIIEKNGLFALKPDQARTAHIGVNGGVDPNNDIRNAKPINTPLIDIDFNWDRLMLDVDRNLAKASTWWYDPNNEFKKYIESCKEPAL